jgi:hypothetical protein
VISGSGGGGGSYDCHHVPMFGSCFFMRVAHVLALLFVVLPFCISASPPKHRPTPTSNNGPQPHAHSDPSSIVPLYKEALKADAEGRAERSLELLSTPPLSLAPGILST